MVLIGLDSILVYTKTDNFALEAYVGNSAVVASRNLGLVCVDEDPRVAGRAAAAIARNNAVVSPPDRLLVNQFHSRQGLWLECGLAIFINAPFLASSAYLKAEVSLLETWAAHSLRPRLLVPGPDFESVRGLVDRRDLRVFGDGRRGLRLGVGGNSGL